MNDKSPHFSRGRIEEAARTSDAIQRARAVDAGAGQAALAQAKDRLGTIPTGGNIL